jgi:hypothetical protein
VRKFLSLTVVGLVVAIAADQLQFHGAHSRQLWQSFEAARDQFDHQVQLVLRQFR